MTVAISGTGGDEIFAGYPWFINMVLHQQRDEKERWKALVASFISAAARRQFFDPLLVIRGGGKLQKIRNDAGFLQRYALNYQIFSARDTARLAIPRDPGISSGRSIRGV